MKKKRVATTAKQAANICHKFEVHPKPFDGVTDDYAADSADVELGDALAWFLGDTFIISDQESPVEQWTNIIKHLRLHGLRITAK